MLFALSLGLLLGRLGHDPRALLPQVGHGEGGSEADAVRLLTDLLQLGEVRDLEWARDSTILFCASLFSFLFCVPG